MHSNSHWGRKWRRYNREHPLHLVTAFLIVLIVAVVGLLMWLMAKPGPTIGQRLRSVDPAPEVKAPAAAF